MALSGPEALKSLDDALRDIRREEDDISKRLARSAERVAKIRESEAELFRQLAEVRLDATAQAELADTISRAERDARARLAQHAETLGAAEEKMAEFDARIIALSGERDEVLKKLDEHQGALKELTASLAPSIAADPAYATAKAEAEELRAVAAEAMRKTEQAEADREQKGRPYRDDKLFMYLWERGYGTRNYSANNLVRWLDGHVARLIDFHKARPNFAMLNEIPLRLREHAERQAEKAEEAQAAQDALETAAIDAAGGRPMRQALEAAQARIAEIDAEIVAVEDERDAHARELRELAQGNDPAFEAAVGALARSLEREDLKQLVDQARRTSTPRDDAILKKIDDARLRVAEEDREAAEQRERLSTLGQRRRELEDIEWEFKKARFDDPRSTFREDRLAGDLLNEFLRGAITAGAYWGEWQRSQSWRPGTTDWGGGFGLPQGGRSSPWTGGTSSGGFNWTVGGGGGGGTRTKSSGSRPSSGGKSSGGGFSRPRSGSSGSRRSGGFKTGGGF